MAFNQNKAQKKGNKNCKTNKDYCNTILYVYTILQNSLHLPVLKQKNRVGLQLSVTHNSGDMYRAPTWRKSVKQQKQHMGREGIGLYRMAQP